jgi:hypothetical protein
MPELGSMIRVMSLVSGTVRERIGSVRQLEVYVWLNAELTTNCIAATEPPYFTLYFTVA